MGTFHYRVIVRREDAGGRVADVVWHRSHRVINLTDATTVADADIESLEVFSGQLRRQARTVRAQKKTHKCFSCGGKVAECPCGTTMVRPAAQPYEIDDELAQAIRQANANVPA